MPGSVVGSVISGVLGSSSNDKAIDAQTAAADKAAEVQKEMYDQTREDLAPFRTSGYAANDLLSKLMGIGAPSRDTVREQISQKYATLFPAKKEQKEPEQVDSNPYILPQAYINTFVPQKMWPQFTKTANSGA